MKIPATWTERDVITTSSSSTSSSANKPKKNKPQQCLRFAPTVEVVEIPNRFDYSREEIEDSWFSALDYEEFRENSYMTMGLHRAGLLSNNSNSNDSEHCMRGLECRLQEVSKERQWTRYHATSAVLNEQYKQYRMGYWNPQAIADLYHAVSWKSQYTAYTQAMLDEQEQQRDTASTAAVTLLLLSNAEGPASPRRSEPKNLLRKVIDIERSETTCSMQSTSSSSFFLQQPATDFDISAFFQEMAVPAQ